MSAYHVFLGRPWQYGICVVHECWGNVLSIVKDGKRYTIIPSKKEGRKDKNPSLMRTYTLWDQIAWDQKVMDLQ